jgi:hypothetical protein
MRKSQKQLLILLSSLVGLTILILAGTCVSIYVRLSQLPPAGFELPDATVDYTRYLPPEAAIISAKADAPDIFGDFTMCAAFQLRDQEMHRLREEGLDWFPPIRGDDRSDNRTWQKGTLSESTISFINEMLGTGLKESDTYTYIDEWVDGGWNRLLVIDEENEIVYYLRVTW